MLSYTDSNLNLNWTEQNEKKKCCIFTQPIGFNGNSIDLPRLRLKIANDNMFVVCIKRKCISICAFHFQHISKFSQFLGKNGFGQIDIKHIVNWQLHWNCVIQWINCYNLKLFNDSRKVKMASFLTLFCFSHSFSIYLVDLNAIILKITRKMNVYQFLPFYNSQTWTWTWLTNEMRITNKRSFRKGERKKN